MPTQAEIEAATEAVEQATEHWLKSAGSWNADIVPNDLLARAALEAAERVRKEQADADAI